MKRILIPTDFTVSSLHLVRDVMERPDSEKCRIILAHGVQLSSSITELLFFSKTKLIAELRNQEFNAAVNVLYNSYRSKIEDVTLDLLHSTNVGYLNSYLEANNVEKIYLPNTESLLLPHKRSINLIPKLRKTDVAFEDLEWHEEHHSRKNENKFIDLFFRKM